MTRTQDFWESAGFVAAKWTGGKFCLGGYRYNDAKDSGTGVGLTVENGFVGATTLPDDDQSCVVVALDEVPCDIRAEGANCVAGSAGASPPSAVWEEVVNDVSNERRKSDDYVWIINRIRCQKDPDPSCCEFGQEWCV